MRVKRIDEHTMSWVPVRAFTYCSRFAYSTVDFLGSPSSATATERDAFDLRSSIAGVRLEERNHEFDEILLILIIIVRI